MDNNIFISGKNEKVYVVLYVFGEKNRKMFTIPPHPSLRSEINIFFTFSHVITAENENSL